MSRTVSSPRQRRDLTTDYDLLTLLENDIKQHYDRKYISLEGVSSIEGWDSKQFCPAEFKELFSDADLQN